MGPLVFNFKMGTNKPHKKSKGGKKRKLKAKRKKGDQKELNPKAYAVHSAVSSKKQLARAADLDQNRYHGHSFLFKALRDFV